MPTGKKLGGAPANFSWHVLALGGEDYVVTDMVHQTGSGMVSLDKSGEPEYIITNSVAYDLYVAAS